jgi:polysaccharide deacetylase 2 family uncharacterized protein YibQ
LLQQTHAVLLMMPLDSVHYFVQEQQQALTVAEAVVNLAAIRTADAAVLGRIACN